MAACLNFDGKVAWSKDRFPRWDMRIEKVAVHDSSEDVAMITFKTEYLVSSTYRGISEDKRVRSIYFSKFKELPVQLWELKSCGTFCWCSCRVWWTAAGKLRSPDTKWWVPNFLAHPGSSRSLATAEIHPAPSILNESYKHKQEINLL